MLSTDPATNGLLIAIFVGLPLTIASFIAFEILRRTCPDVFDFRRVLHSKNVYRGYDGENIKLYEPPSLRCFGWISNLVRIDFQQLEDTHGLDVLFLVRFLVSKAQLFFVVSLLCSCILIPTFYTGRNKDRAEGDPRRTVGLQIISIVNLDTEASWQFWAVLLVQVLVALCTLFFLYRDYEEFIASRRRYLASRNPSNFAVLVDNIHRDRLSESNLAKSCIEHCPNDVQQIYFVPDFRETNRQMRLYRHALLRRERAERKLGNCTYDDTRRPACVPGYLAHFWTRPLQENEVDIWRTKEQQFMKDVETSYVRASDNTECLRCALITFKTKLAARTFVIKMRCSCSGEWQVVRAPEPLAINWNALSLPKQQDLPRILITVSGILALIVLWSIPVAFIQGIANVRSLLQIRFGNLTPFQFLNGVKHWSPVYIALLEGCLPATILGIMHSVVPYIIQALVSISRVVSLGRKETLVRNWYIVFLFFNAFLVVVLYGSIAHALPLFFGSEAVGVRDILYVTNFFAVSISNQGAFFMTFIIYKCLASCLISLIQLPRLALWILTGLVRARATQDTEEGRHNYVSNSYFDYYASGQLVVLLGIVFCTIYPGLTLSCLVYFCVTFLSVTFNVTYTVVDEYHAAGSMFPGSITWGTLCVAVQQFVMFGFFGFRWQKLQSGISLALAIACVCILLYTQSIFRSSGLDVAEYDDMESAAPIYVPPGLEKSLSMPPGAILYEHPLVKKVFSLLRYGSQRREYSVLQLNSTGPSI
jgi:calcium permeable stress-gated cation channel